MTTEKLLVAFTGGDMGDANQQFIGGGHQHPQGSATSAR